MTEFRITDETGKAKAYHKCGFCGEWDRRKSTFEPRVRSGGTETSFKISLCRCCHKEITHAMAAAIGAQEVMQGKKNKNRKTWTAHATAEWTPTLPGTESENIDDIFESILDQVFPDKNGKDKEGDTR